MTDVAILIADLVAAGTPAALIGRVAAALAEQSPGKTSAKDEAAERRRAWDRERKRRQKDGSTGNPPEHDVENPVESDVEIHRKSTGNPQIPRAHVEDKSLLTEIEPQEGKKESKTPKGDLFDFQNEFSDLDADHLQALIKHRRSKRAQNTGHAAKLFRRDAESCGLTITEAVDMCISRNWVTVKPDWLAPRQRGSPGRPLTGLAALTEQFKQELQNDGYGRESEEGLDHVADARFPLLTGPDHR